MEMNQVYYLILLEGEEIGTLFYKEKNKRGQKKMSKLIDNMGQRAKEASYILMNAYNN